MDKLISETKELIRSLKKQRGYYTNRTYIEWSEYISNENNIAHLEQQVISFQAMGEAC